MVGKAKPIASTRGAHRKAGRRGDTDSSVIDRSYD
jgi:hypothetical protein